MPRGNFGNRLQHQLAGRRSTGNRTRGAARRGGRRRSGENDKMDE